MAYLTEKDIDKLTSETGQILAAQPKVSIMVHNGREYWEGGINGHMFRIKTGELVEVPQDLAVLIKQNAKVMEQSKKEVEEFRKPSGKNIMKG